MIRNVSWRWKLTVAFLLVALLPVLVLGVVNTGATQRALQDAADDRLLAAAAQTATSLDTFMVTNLAAIRTEAQMPVFANYLALSPEERSGSLLQSEAIAVLRSLSRKDPVQIAAYRLLDAQGRDVLDTTTLNVGSELGEQAFFEEPLATGLPYVSSVHFLSDLNNTAVLYFSSPVRLNPNEVVGVLAVEYNAAVLQQIVVQATGQLGDQSFGILIDENLLRLAHGTRPSLLYTAFTSLPPALVADLDKGSRLPQDFAPASVVDLPLLSSYLANENSSPTFTTDQIAVSDERYRVAKSRLQSQTWTVAFFQPEEILLAPVASQIQAVQLLGVLIALGATLLALAIARNLTNPVLRLTETAEAIAAGDLAKRADVTARDEIGILGKTFNGMAEQLQESLQGLAQNVADLQRTEQALRESEAEARKLSIVASRTSNMVVILDSHYQIEWVNEAFVKGTGYTLAEVSGQLLGELLRGPETDPKTTAYIREQLAQNLGYHCEIVIYRKERTPFWVEIDLQVIKDELGNPMQYIAVMNDITARKRSEAEQARLIAEMEVVNQELENFAYVASHDLKAPLRAIGSLSSWLSADHADQLDEAGQELVGLINGRVHRMESLIDGILQYSRIGRASDERTAVDLNLLLIEVIDLLAPPPSIQITIPGKLPIVYAEKTRMGQLFQNLISNAIKFMDKPQGKIDLQHKEVNGYWQFSMMDNGSGIEPKYFDKIFQLFQTLNPRDELESSGVGLSLVKKIVEMYGGQIWLESVPGESTTFHFTLPQQASPKYTHTSNDRESIL